MKIILHTNGTDYTPYRNAKRASEALGLSYNTINNYLSRQGIPFEWEGGKLERLEVK